MYRFFERVTYLLSNMYAPADMLEQLIDAKKTGDTEKYLQLMAVFADENTSQHYISKVSHAIDTKSNPLRSRLITLKSLLEKDPESESAKKAVNDCVKEVELLNDVTKDIAANVEVRDKARQEYSLEHQI